MNYFQKRKNAFKYAGIGIYKLLRDEDHAKIHIVAAVCVVITGFLLHISAVEWCLISLCIGGVLMAEGFNTAIEKLADRVTRERDPLIGTAKDVAAGAVLLFVLTAIAVGLIIFLPKLIQLLP